MDINSNNVMRDKWRQVRFEVVCSTLPTNDNKVFERRIPVSGILCNSCHLASQSFSGTIVSALPDHSAAVDLQEWGTIGIPTCRVPFKGVSLFDLGFPNALRQPFCINPFVQKVTQDASQGTSSFSPIGILKEDGFCGEYFVNGICYRQQKSVDATTKSYEFLHWAECQLQQRSSKDAFTSFVVKVEMSDLISFLGAPILTKDRAVSSIVVHQQELADGITVIVGMRFRDFIDRIPLFSTLCV